MSTFLAVLRVFFTGLCMGAADLVPGISGGTIAFIMGIYEPLIDAIKSVSWKSIVQRTLPSRFLISLLSGMACAFLFFSHAIAYLLHDADLRILLYAWFMGLIASSVCFLIRQMKNWRVKDAAALFIGAVTAYLLSGQQFASTNDASILTSLISPWLIFSGAAAISAMLLPGISGSYLLMILGVYPIALEALTDFSSGLKNGAIDFPSMIILSNILFGIILGALIFSHVISWLLKKYHKITLALLIGFMIGAVRTAWPFWEITYILHPFKPEKGLVPLLLHPIFPDVTSLVFWKAVSFALLGFLLLFLPDLITRKYNLRKA